MFHITKKLAYTTVKSLLYNSNLPISEVYTRNGVYSISKIKTTVPYLRYGQTPVLSRPLTNLLTQQINNQIKNISITDSIYWVTVVKSM